MIVGFWSNILDRAATVAAFYPRVEHIGGREDLLAYYSRGDDIVEHATPASLWRSQPHLRTVVSFLARNVAQLGLHAFERDGETDRVRDRTSLLARTLVQPDAQMTAYDLIYALVGDLLLYDRAYWYVGPSSDTTRSGTMLRRLPPSWIEPVERDAYTVQSYRASLGNRSVEIPAEQVLAFTGYSPTDPLRGSPTVESLRDVLREQVEAARYRRQVWRRGGRVSAVLQRPAGAPPWSDNARERFREDWYAKYTGRGARAGGTPILEDGMTLNRIDFNAQEQQFVEAAKLSLVTVAAAFHVNPTMIGQNDSANYSNVREFRRMLYGDTLGPMLAQIESRLNAFLLPMLGMDADAHYVEFNIAEKLQGSFEEQAAVMQTLVGAPIMTRNEGRARFNLPQVNDADGLVTPLNVIVGGQASPTDSGSQNRKPKALVKSRAGAQIEDVHVRAVRKFFERQEAVVRSRLGAKASGEWWDAARWDRELAGELLKLAVLAAGEVGAKTAASLGFDEDDYDADRTLAFLKAVAESDAALINEKTREAIEAALGEVDPADAVAGVFETAKGSRSEQIATSLVTAASGFATAEAARQLVGDGATKTWVTGRNPRPAHAAMNGETVPVNTEFSNGLKYPGSRGPADEVAGCNCSIRIDVP